MGRAREKVVYVVVCSNIMIEQTTKEQQKRKERDETYDCTVREIKKCSEWISCFNYFFTLFTLLSFPLRLPHIMYLIYSGLRSTFRISSFKNLLFFLMIPKIFTPCLVGSAECSFQSSSNNKQHLLWFQISAASERVLKSSLKIIGCQ